MKLTVRSLATYYLISTIWLLVLVAVTGAFVGPIDSIRSEVGLSPLVGTLFMLGFAIGAASLAATLAWVGIRRAGRSGP
jgi:uncharacterized membrane protein YciS (DUF1049 family)